jgi:hypothetical protein
VVSTDTAALFLDRSAALMTPSEALDLLVAEAGTLTSPVRGIRHAGSASTLAHVPIGGPLSLARDY